MAFVLDASVTACWAFADEDHPIAAAAFVRLQSDAAHVPGLWWYEIRNILVVNERRGRITKGDTETFLLSVARLGVRIHNDPHEAGVLALARRHRLSAYDASYLELARRLGLVLATLDARLASAAKDEQVPLLQP